MGLSEVCMQKFNQFDVLKSLIEDQRAGAKDPNHPIHDRLKASLKAKAERLKALKDAKKDTL
jgi:DNA-binding Lrp family transcriptional regulator